MGDNIVLVGENCSILIWKNGEVVVCEDILFWGYEDAEVWEDATLFGNEVDAKERPSVLWLKEFDVLSGLKPSNFEKTVVEESTIERIGIKFEVFKETDEKIAFVIAETESISGDLKIALLWLELSNGLEVLKDKYSGNLSMLVEFKLK